MAGVAVGMEVARFGITNPKVMIGDRTTNPPANLRALGMKEASRQLQPIVRWPDYLINYPPRSPRTLGIGLRIRHR